MSWLESESRIYKEPSVLSQFWCDKKSTKKTSRYGSCSLFLFLSLGQNQQNLQILTSIPESIEAFTRAIPENTSSRLKTICLVQQRFFKILQLGGWMVFQSETWTISRMQNLKLRQLLHKASRSPPPVWKWVDWWIFQIHKKTQYKYQPKCKDKYTNTQTWNLSKNLHNPIFGQKNFTHCKSVNCDYFLQQ